MIIRSRKRSNSSTYVRPKDNEVVKEEKKVEKKVRERKAVKKEEPILPLVEEALASIEE